jgi:hypothetical protein
MTSPFRQGESIEVRAARPDGDLACDFTIADGRACAGLREAKGFIREIFAGVRL